MEDHAAIEQVVSNHGITMAIVSPLRQGISLVANGWKTPPWTNHLLRVTLSRVKCPCKGMFCCVVLGIGSGYDATDHTTPLQGKYERGISVGLQAAST